MAPRGPTGSAPRAGAWWSRPAQLCSTDTARGSIPRPAPSCSRPRRALWRSARARSSRAGSSSRRWCNERLAAVFGRARTEPERDSRRDPQRDPLGVDVDRAAVAAAKRHPQRFAALYRKYLPQVYSFAFYELGNHHDAEDLTERVFLSALSALPAFEERSAPGSTFRVWLFRIARNSISNQRRTLARRREAPAALAEH